MTAFQFPGLNLAIATPFDAQGKVDLKRLEANIEHYLAAGVKGFVLSSGTGMSNMIIVTGLGSTFTNSGGATIGGSFNSLIITNGGRFLLGSGALTDLTTTRDDIQAQLDANKNSSDLETELAALKADVANGK